MSALCLVLGGVNLGLAAYIYYTGKPHTLQLIAGVFVVYTGLMV